METMPAISSLALSLRRFFVREDQAYERYEAVHAAKSRLAKAVYVFLYLLPGIVACVALNVPSVFRAQLALTGLSPKYLQYAWVLLITFGWHIFVLFLVMRYADRLTLRESFGFLGLNRVDWRGLLVVMPVFALGFALVSWPYMRFVWPKLEEWLNSVPLFRIPPYSIFQDVPDNIYSFPPVALVLLFLGNFVGEEVYFRGYLMKKTAFLGRANWVVNSVLFALYHLWQIPQTWPLVGLALAFGLLMSLRKDIYVLIAFHLFVNIWLAFGTG